MIEDIVADILEMPCLTEDDVVYDGSFCCTPILTSGIRGNGKLQSTYDMYAIDIFKESKQELISNTKKIFKNIDKTRYICGDPNYEYERNAHLWRATLNISELEG